MLDERRISTGSTVRQEELEKVPTARDPWTTLQKTPGVLTDRINVGGNESGQSPSSGAASNTAQTRVLFTETQVDRLSTFGLDVDTASYTVVRNYLRNGHLPPPAVVRVEEIVNFFSYGDPAPARGAFAIRAEGAPSPFAPGPEYRLLRFNLRAREVKPENRRPAVLTLVIDVSGSMNEGNRLGLVKRAVPLLLEQMRPQDKVGVVVYGNNARVALEPTADREAVRRTVEGLVPEGSTNAEEGLVLGYATASRHFRPGGINRVILCSDGVANVGKTSAEDILARIGAAAKGGIELTTLGFGMGEYNDAFMERLADKGNGRYAYVDTLDEARRVLVDEITGSLTTIARDAKAQVDFNPAVVERWRLIGYENRLIQDRRFRDDSIDAGEVGAGHSVTALYEVKLKPGARPEQRIATFQLRFREPDMGALQETARDLRVADLAASWEQAPAGLRFASVVAELAEVLKRSPEAADLNLKRVLRRLQQVVPAFERSPRAADVVDFVELVRAAVRIQGAR
jgi:Ca-activated chloride channel family protein